jgi:hypothetical protein
MGEENPVFTDVTPFLNAQIGEEFAQGLPPSVGIGAFDARRGLITNGMSTATTLVVAPTPIIFLSSM